MIDWTRVTELRDEIGGEDFAEVVTLFLEEADVVVQNLPGCVGSKALESALHFIKGSALNLGFADLARLCQDGERRAAAGDVTVDVGGVIAAYEASKVAFETGLDHLSGTRAA